MKAVPLTLALLLPVYLASQASAVELMRWERIPLPVPLTVGQERIVFADRNVRVGFPASLNGKLRIQSTGGAVYLQASAPFDTTRVQLKDMTTGELVLLDLSAAEGQTVREPVRLVYSGEVTANTDAGEGRVTGTATPSETPSTSTALGQTSRPAVSKTPVPVALTRYAAQRLYAPARSVESLTGVRSVAVSLPSPLTSLLPAQPVTVTPLTAWQLGQYRVVALKLTNRSGQRVTLDPRQLQGQFYSATFQHAWLGGAGTPEDTTSLYLVTTGRPEAAFVPEPRVSADAAKKKTATIAAKTPGEGA